MDLQLGLSFLPSRAGYERLGNETVVRMLQCFSGVDIYGKLALVISGQSARHIHLCHLRVGHGGQGRETLYGWRQVFE